MVGAVLVLLAMFVVGPIAIFATGAIWSALNGWMQSADADDRASATETTAA